MNINQAHYGSGDNVFNQYGDIPKLEYILRAKSEIPEGYQYEYEINITPVAKSFDSLNNLIRLHPQLTSSKIETVSTSLMKIPGNCSSIEIKLISKTEISDDGNLFSL